VKLVKTATFIIGMAVAMNIVACAQQSKEEVSKIAKKMEGKDKPEVVNDDVGGQPMQIKVSGAAVKSDGGQMLILDSRITATQTMGANEKGEQNGMVDAKHKIALERWSGDKLETLASDTTFINLGCPADAELTKGLTEAQPEKGENVIQGQAKLIMICGAQRIPSEFMLFKAQHLLLNSAALKGSPASGLSFSAETVTLIGANSIEVKDYMPEDEKSERRLEINAASKLEGQGTLSIKTEGADDDVSSDEETAEQTILESQDLDEAPGADSKSDTKSETKSEAEANQASSVQASHK
jgi:hypothetical protein